jgi:hypothetical protein
MQLVYSKYKMNASSNNNNILITKLHCNLYRVGGFLLLFFSLINLLISFRYFTYRYYNKKQRVIINHLSSIIMGMLISSILVIFTGIPLLIIQCFTCRPYLFNEILCKVHGFVCFATGLYNM